MRKCEFKINNKAKSFDVEGDFFWGENIVLYNPLDNVISKVDWRDRGYNIEELLTQSKFNKLRKSISDLFINILLEEKVDIPEDFNLELYHNYVISNDQHFKIISRTRELKNEDFDFELDEILHVCSEILGYKLTSINPVLGRSHVQLRISRPNSLDINPLHRDSYLDIYKKCINIWLPIFGCDENSNLPILPGSQFINEKNILRSSSRGATINGAIYNVPCILDIKGEMNLKREFIKEGSGLIFTPFLIHGAGFNDNFDKTRFSLELRLTKID